MIIIINFFSSCCRPREWVSLMCYLPIREKVQLPHQVLLSAHSLLSRETPCPERTHLSYKDLAFRSVVEGVPNCFLRVSYEDTLLRFGFELIRLNPFDISVATPNFKKRQLRFLAKPQFIRCCLNGFRRCPILREYSCL